jgi:predicted acylesterase/phospholipase RssA
MKTSELTTKECLQEAPRMLSGEHFTTERIRAVARKLKSVEKYSIAAELFLLLLPKSSAAAVRKDRLDLVICFYKDIYLPSKVRFGRALEHLNRVEEVATSTEYEVLGVAGAIYKHKWMTDHQDEDLLTSKDFYRRGYELWEQKTASMTFSDTFTKQKVFETQTGTVSVLESVDKDAGYTAINYGYILELLAWNRMLRKDSIGAFTFRKVTDLCQQARDVRQTVLRYFGDEDQWKNRPDWQVERWVFATMGEACFGLGDYAGAQKYYQTYQETRADSWQTSSTAKQLSNIASVHEQISQFFSTESDKYRAQHAEMVDEAMQLHFYTKHEAINTAAENCLSVLIPKAADQGLLENPDLALRGKVGLALSGGGFRAALYHIGVLARLAERDVLRYVEVISCVSGGSIIGSFYYLKLQQMLEQAHEKQVKLTPQMYVQLVREVESEFLHGVQKNLRLRILCNFWSNLRIFFDQSYTRTHRLGKLYERYFYNRFKKNKSSEPTVFMQELQVKLGTDFSPMAENWYRSYKVPVLVLNATSLNTGHNFQFTASWMGEPPGAIDSELDAKPRLRRMYYSEAPEPYKNKIRLGHAVGASSCVPALFEPIMFSDLYENMELRLVDGGVHDNQGIGSLVEQQCQVMIISDASGQMTNEELIGAGPTSAFMRSDLVLQERVREKQLSDLVTRSETGLLNGLAIMHLKRDLQTDPIKWKHCDYPTKSTWLTQSNAANKDLTTYGIRTDIATELSKIRTDLDAFSDSEAYALMFAGYQQTESELEKTGLMNLFQQDGVSANLHPTKPDTENTATPAPNPWNFLSIKPYMEQAETSVPLLHRLRIGQSLMFKVFQLNTALILIPFLIGGAVLAVASYFFYANLDQTITLNYAITLKAIGWALGLILADQLIGFGVSRVYNFKGTFVKILVLGVFALFASIFSWLFLLLSHHVYLFYGKVGRLAIEDKVLNYWRALMRFLGR